MKLPLRAVSRGTRDTSSSHQRQHSWKLVFSTSSSDFPPPSSLLGGGCCRPIGRSGISANYCEESQPRQACALPQLRRRYYEFGRPCTHGSALERRLPPSTRRRPTLFAGVKGLGMLDTEGLGHGPRFTGLGARHLSLLSTVSRHRNFLLSATLPGRQGTVSAFTTNHRDKEEDSTISPPAHVPPPSSSTGGVSDAPATAPLAEATEASTKKTSVVSRSRDDNEVLSTSASTAPPNQPDAPSDQTTQQIAVAPQCVDTKQDISRKDFLTPTATLAETPVPCHAPANADVLSATNEERSRCEPPAPLTNFSNPTDVSPPNTDATSQASNCTATDHVEVTPSSNLSDSVCPSSTSRLVGTSSETTSETTSAFSAIVNASDEALVVVPENAATVRPDESRKSMKPKELVEHLDKYIIGQAEAKRAVANALRNRWRRQQLQDSSLRDDIVPKNILMIGPTGVGKTEIARRLSKVVDAPFIKVEATKFTEVGFHGRDVDQIIKDLAEVAVKQQKSKTESEYRAKAEETAEQSILETLLGKLSREDKKSWLGHLRMGLLDDRIIQVDVPVNLGGQPSTAAGGTSLGSDAIDAIAEAVSSLSVKPFKVVHGRGTVERKSLSVKEAKQLLVQSQLDTMINQETIVRKALESAEQEGIVFVDEIDKICTKGHGGYTGPDASAEGVQRDLLPLIEGSSVTTKYGNVKTDYILFIASGAFHSVKPSDMLAELQGRLPVRVELKPLTTVDFVSILQTPRHNLIMQNKELLATEGIELQFTEDAIQEIARVSSEVNTHVENIGARRLHTIIEKIMEDINYNAPNMEPGCKVVIDLERVRGTVGEYLKKTDLHKFIL